jgi:signal transduction histidine kinase
MDENNNEIAGIKDIVEIAELLLACRGAYQKAIDVIVGSALRISGADRTCLILKDKKEELIIKSGLPKNAHGIGEKITPETGEIFLKQMMSNESVILVTNPSEDSRVSFMRELVMTHRISSILFLPLFFESESIGILVFDWVQGRKFSKEVSGRIKILGRLASRAIGMEYKGRKDQEKILQDETLRILGEHSSQVAHIIRNSLMVIGGFSERLLRCLSKESELGKSKIHNETFNTLWESAKIIDNESRKLEGIVNDVLTYASLKKPALEAYCINEFLKGELACMGSNGPKPILKLSKRLNGVHTAFDKKMLAICIADLVRYAAESSASRIVIKTKLKPKQKEIVLSVINNGKRINPHIVNEIFSPFVTTEIDGTGLGLANVQSIIRSHGGNICVLSGDTTEFRITLPLIKV